MHALFTTNAHGADSTLVAMDSFRRHHPHWQILLGHTGALTSELRGYAETFGVALRELPDQFHRFAGVQRSIYGSDALCAAKSQRLWLIDALLAEARIDRALCLDSDTLTQGALVELEQPGPAGRLIGASRELNQPNPTEDEIRYFGQFNETYFNAGVLMLELDRIRAADVPSLGETCVAHCHEWRLPDQDVLNLLFPSDVQYALPADVNDLPARVASTPERIKHNDRVAHFFLKAKPWQPDSMFFDWWRSMPYERYAEAAERCAPWLSERFLRSVRSTARTVAIRREREEGRF